MYFEVKKKTGFGKVMKKSAGCGIRKSPSRPLRDRKKNRGQASRLRQMTNELHLGTWCNHAIGRGGVAWRHLKRPRERLLETSNVTILDLQHVVMYARHISYHVYRSNWIQTDMSPFLVQNIYKAFPCKTKIQLVSKIHIPLQQNWPIFADVNVYIFPH